MISTASTATTVTELHRCLRCHRPVRSAEAIATGYGAGCRAKIRRAAKTADLSAWSGRQVEQARELIEDGGLVPAGREGVFFAVSTDGSEFYRCTAGSCECPAGEKDRRQCYHRCAVAIVTASAPPAAHAALVPVLKPFAAVPAPAPETTADDVWALLEAVGATGPAGFVPAF